MKYHAQDGKDYILNLIDTPGHVDFSYEVSRALHACEGAILVVDAAQGIEAQTLANAYLALDANLALIPIANKIDLPSADPIRVAQEIEDVIGLAAESVLPVSAKEGKGILPLLERIVSRGAAAGGRRRAADARADLRRLVRFVRGRGDAGAAQAGAPPPGRPHPADGEGQRARDHRARRDRPAPAQGRRAGGRRGGHRDRRHQDARPGAHRRHRHARGRPGARGAPRLPRGEADGVQRPLPDRGRRVSPAQDRAREAAPQRLLVPVRARDERRARLRLPLRLPRLPALRDHPGAARARVQPVADRDGAHRPLPRRHHRGRGVRDRVARRAARSQACSSASKSR